MAGYVTPVAGAYYFSLSGILPGFRLGSPSLTPASRSILSGRFLYSLRHTSAHRAACCSTLSGIWLYSLRQGSVKPPARYSALCGLLVNILRHTTPLLPAYWSTYPGRLLYLMRVGLVLCDLAFCVKISLIYQFLLISHLFALKPGRLILFFIAKKSMQKRLGRMKLQPTSHRTPAILPCQRTSY